MKVFIKNSYLFLIFFILLIIKPFLYGLLSPKEKIEITNLYVNKLENEIKNIKIIDNIFLNTKGVYGKVLYQNPYKFIDELVIATNTDNINKNNYVINDKGLIGIVDKIYQNQVIVKMLTSKDILLQIRVNNCYGLLSYDKKLIISNINNYCQINPEDEVFTSNLGYQDEEVLIGKVGTIYIDSNRLIYKYEVNPVVDFNNLNYVVILSSDSP